MSAPRVLLPVIVIQKRRKMNENFKVKKIILHSKEPRIQFAAKEQLELLQGSRRMLLQILEIEAENPGDLIFVVTVDTNGNIRRTPFYLFTYRDKMLFQEGKYILRFDCVIELVGKNFEIEIVTESDKPFKVTAYYSLH